MANLFYHLDSRGPLTDEEIEQLGYEAAEKGETLNDWSLAPDEQVPFERGLRRYNEQHR